MTLSPVVHTSKHVIALINDVVRCHTDMVQTVNGLKDPGGFFFFFLKGPFLVGKAHDQGFSVSWVVG